MIQDGSQRELSADDYIKHHWQRRSVWKHLTRRRHLRRLHKCADIMEGETFADVGCATGHSTNIMKQRHPGNWTGIDFSITATELACREFPDIQFHYCKSIDNLRASGRRFDGVVCSEVIEHVDNDTGLRDALKAITTQVLVVTTPCVPIGDPGHLRVYSESQLQALFGDDATIESVGDFWYLTWRPS